MNTTNFEKELTLAATSLVTPLEISAIQAASPIVLALAECGEELRAEAVELFKALASGKLDEEQRIATITLLAEILFPNADDKGLPGLDLVEAEELAPKVNPEAEAVLGRMDAEEADFAKRLRHLMEAKNMTQAELASAVGIGQPAVSMMLNRTCRPQKKTVMRFAQALGVAPEELWPGIPS
jgi:lambda repressor-like predicted transcriptional regulator